MTLALELGLLAFVLACALAVLVLRDVLSVIIAFAAYSLGISLIWVVLQAPDVALTEAAVGAGVMTVFLLMTIARTVRPEHDRLLERLDPKTGLLVAAFVGVLALTLPALPEIGDPGAPVVDYRVTEHYLAHAYKETGVKNAVTAVLAAYRGFDTLGEVVVVFTAGVTVMTVLKQEVFV